MFTQAYLQETKNISWQNRGSNYPFQMAGTLKLFVDVYNLGSVIVIGSLNLTPKLNEVEKSDDLCL